MAKRGKFSVAETRLMLRAASAYLDDIRKHASDEVIQRFIAESRVNQDGVPYIPLNVRASAFDEETVIVYCLPADDLKEYHLQSKDLAEYRVQSTGAIRRVVSRREVPGVK
jgi:hypothetical protein